MLMQALRLTLLALAIVLAAGLVACGGDNDDDETATSTSSTASGSDEDQIRDVMSQYEQSLQDDDAELLCSLLAPADVRRAGGGGLEECIAASDTPDNILFSAEETDLPVEEVIIDPSGDRAAAVLEGGNSSTLVKVDGVWYITFGAELKK